MSFDFNVLRNIRWEIGKSLDTVVLQAGSKTPLEEVLSTEIFPYGGNYRIVIMCMGLNVRPCNPLTEPIAGTTILDVLNALFCGIYRPISDSHYQLVEHHISRFTNERKREILREKYLEGSLTSSHLGFPQIFTGIGFANLSDQRAKILHYMYEV